MADETRPAPGAASALFGYCALLLGFFAIGIVTLWLDGPLESRCGSLGTTPEGLTAQVTALLEGMLTGGAAA